MTYARLLLQFLAVPIIVLAMLVLRDEHQQKRDRGAAWQGGLPYMVLVALIGVAILYTLPWDNHLIATRVWWYRPTLVSGIAFGWIPLEEVIFFPLQTLLIGLWCLWLLPRLASRTATEAFAGDGSNTKISLVCVIAGSCLWLIALVVLRLGWQPGTYLGWELVWGLAPLILQLGLGADILWRYRRLLCATLVPAIPYLCAIDTLAIHNGIWTISPQQSLGILIGGQLPLEEVVFFSLTSALVASGLLLGVTAETRERLQRYRALLGLSKESRRFS
ncbi:MAG TPA: lycopene cyclase domain-containing protein [Ktedonobacterales bacterium]|jgi:lycopene cyclase domain-containing protein|nr:lycopene cyclase domain-containing protein [Ktedonobacterales bacterium]